MLYMVIKPGKYIASIIDGTQAMVSFMNDVPVGVRHKLQVHPVGLDAYPFKILEFELKGKIGFIAAKTDKDLKTLINAVEQGKGKALITYRIDKDFLGDPKDPGGDYMGMLNHDHLTED